MKECPECGAKPIIETYKNEIYCYEQISCECGEPITYKYFNDDGDIELQKLLYGRQENETKVKFERSI